MKTVLRRAFTCNFLFTSQEIFTIAKHMSWCIHLVFTSIDEHMASGIHPVFTTTNHTLYLGKNCDERNCPWKATFTFLSKCFHLYLCIVITHISHRCLQNYLPQNCYKMKRIILLWNSLELLRILIVKAFKKALWQNEEMLVTSIFSFSHNVFLPCVW